MLDVIAFLTDFQDYLAPKLDVYEQAIYMYVFRHSRFVGKEEVVIGFKSARARIAASYRYKRQPISMEVCYAKLRTLQEKGCLEVVTVEQNGTRVRLRLPSEIPGLATAPVVPASVNLEEMDFFAMDENRALILLREGHSCFYCLRSLTADNHVIEHVLSRPAGNNSYRNVVAACRQCNNRKGDSDAEDFLRALYRESLLSV
ncbi:MAG TPA: HNH endonuclease signature motif containing protein, partial [Fimbriiglobus sp.]|nr:HNH endonuclease signature motif containing protein [Fimbriiglobus sp.]